MSLLYKKLMDNSMMARYLYWLVDDIRREWRYKSGNISASPGMRHADKTTKESVDYINQVFSDYKQYAGVERFSGRVAEVGPGDSIGVALKFLTDGCSSVHLIDRFFVKRNIDKNGDIIRYYFDRHPELPRRYGSIESKSDSELEKLGSTFGSSICRFSGNDACAEKFFRPEYEYDWIVSRSVLEHLYDPILALRNMAVALVQGGTMIHKVDLRDHGMFSLHSHELKFFELPDWLYRRMSLASGRPNRILVDSYQETLKNAGLKHQIMVTRLAGVGEISPHQPLADIPHSVRSQSIEYVENVREKFSQEFQIKPLETLMVTGFMLAATRN